MAQNNVGRPKKYPYNQLKEILYNYITDNSVGKVTFTKLAKYSGIPYHVWRDNKEINKDIEEVNSYSMKLNTSNNELHEIFNVLELFELFYEDKELFRGKLIKFSHVYEELYLKCIELEKIEIENYNLKYENDMLSIENRKLRKEIDDYKNNLGIINSVYGNTKRENELNIEVSVLDKEFINEKAVSTDIKDLKNLYPELFL